MRPGQCKSAQDSASIWPVKSVNRDDDCMSRNDNNNNNNNDSKSNNNGEENDNLGCRCLPMSADVAKSGIRDGCWRGDCNGQLW